MKQEWVVDMHEAKIDLDRLIDQYSELGQSTYIHFTWDYLENEVDAAIWEKVLEAGLPQEVDEFYLLVWW